MTIEWDGYTPYEPGVAGPPRALPRAEARKLFQRCMETTPARLQMIRRLLRANGVELENSDTAIQNLNEWFFNNVEADPQHPGRLLPDWYSVVHDVALFLGEVMIERHPNLRWEFFTWGKTSVAYQRHVIMGLSTEDPKFRTNIDIDGMVSGYAHQIIESRGSVQSYGLVNVRGTMIDVDASVARFREREIDVDMFRHRLEMVARRA